MDSVYNNTFVPLNAGQSWEGKSESISKFTVASVSCITDTSGTLHLYFSLNNNNFDFIKTYTLRPNEPFIINQKVEGKWFKAKVINNSGINQTYLRLTTTYKEDIRSDLDIRPLHSEKDTISIPALNECIVDGKLVVSVESVTVSGVTVDISGQTVNIDGQMVKSRLYDSNGYAFGSQLADGSRALTTYNLAGIRAKEGTTVKEVNAVTDANHGGTNLCVYDDVLNDKINNVNIAGEDLGAIKVFVSNTAAQKLNCAVNTITGFATETTADSILTQLEKNTYDSSGNIKVAGSVTVNTISGFATETTADSILTQLEKNTYDSSGNLKIAGSVTVNTISGFAVESGGNLADIKTNTGRIKSDTTYADAVQVAVKNTIDVSGNVNVNTISGFALENGGNLASIKTNTDKNNYDASGNLKVNLATGSITVSAVNIKDSSGNNIYADGSGNLKTNIQNSFLDVHNKVYHNSSWIDLVGASNGHLIVNSSTQDGAGTDITSTVVGSKTGLDVNIAGGSSTSLIKDSSGNGISAQVAGAAYAGYLNTYNPHLANATLDNSITTISKSLVQGSSPNVYLSNRCNSIGDQYVVLSTNGGGNTVAFDNTSNNNKVKIDPSNNTVSFASGQSVGITSSSNTVKIGDASNEVLTLSPTQHDATKIAADTNAHMVGYSRTDSGYNTATLVRPYTSNSTANSVRAVESYSYNVCLNNSSNLYLPVTSTTTDTTQSMDTFINNDSTINNYATTGLNMYQIYPKRKTYQLSGISSTGALNTMLSSFGTNTTFSAVSWGQTALKTFYASMGAGGTTKYLRFEYVDSNGDLQTTGTVGVGTGSGTTPLFVSVVGINRIYFASAAQSGANNQAFGTADGLYVSTTSGSTAPSYYGGFYYANWNSTYTCPNFKVAILKNFTFYASSGSDVYAFVCDSTGGRRMLLQVINASNFIYQVVDLQINPGETLFFGTGNSTTPLNKQVFAQIYQYDV